MDNISSAPVWDPANWRSRHAETTGDIHRVMAVVCGGFGTLFALAGLASNRRNVEGDVLATGVLAALAAWHASFAFGATQRRDTSATPAGPDLRAP